MAMTEKQRAYQRAYRQRPEVQAKQRAYGQKMMIALRRAVQVCALGIIRIEKNEVIPQPEWDELVKLAYDGPDRAP